MVLGADFELRRRELVLSMLALLSGCGGVDSGGTGTGAQATFATGPITGFGSIIVNGVRYDDSAATVVDDAGATRLRSELRLGMQAEVSASPIITVGGVANATASEIRVRSEIVGPLELIDIAQARLTVLGQTVSVLNTTVFDSALVGGLAALAVGDVLEVYAALDVAAGRYVATRIERRTDGADYRLRGVVAALSLPAKTIRLGGLDIDWSAMAPAEPATALAVGRFVRVTLARAPVAGIWQARSLSTGVSAPSDREFAEVEGRISAFTSAASFAVDGIAVDAAAASYPNGAAGLALGVRVEVKGLLRGGVLVAARVKFERDDEGPEPIELQGNIEAVDLAAMRFVVRSVTVVWSANTRFDSSQPSDIAVGRRVAVRGALSRDGTRLEASSIHVER